MNPKKENLKIEGQRLYMRVLRAEDASIEYVEWLKDREVNKYLETKDTTLDELREYIRKKRESADNLFLGIFLKNSGKHIGNIKLEPLDLQAKKATLGLLIGDKGYWGRGLGTEAVKMLSDYAFDELDLTELDLRVVKDNKSAIKVYEKAGFKRDRDDGDSIWMTKRR